MNKMKCNRCDHPAEVLSFYVEEENEEHFAEEKLCRQCHSARVNESRGMFYSFQPLNQKQLNEGVK